SNARDAISTGKLTFKADALNTFGWTGNVQLEPLRVDGKLELSDLRLSALRPYYESSLELDIRQGTLDLGTSFSASLNGDKFQVQLSDFGAVLKSLQANLPGEKDAIARIPLLEINGASADLAKRTLTIGEIKGRDAGARIVRTADGRINLARIVRPAAKPTDTGTQSDAAPWDISVKRVALDRFALDYDDLTQKTPIRSRVSALALTAENLSNAKAAKGTLNIRALVNNAGKLALGGQVGINPVSLRMRVDATAVDILPIQPLVEDMLNIAITSGGLSARGALALDAPPGVPMKATFKGDAGITEFASIDKLTLEDLLKWKSLYVTGIDAALEPLQATVGGVALTDFYSRLIVNPDGTFNLQHLVKKTGEPEAQGMSPPDQTLKSAGPSRAVAANSVPPAAPAQPGAGGLPPNFSIGKITLQNGTVNFADHFIKPNYSADLSELSGSIGRMTQDTAGDVEIKGMVQKTAPLEIIGRLNPLAKDLLLDIKASAKDVELSPLTPYAIKYAGYGIEKGKLSMQVKYHVENRKLVAENHINLNQLTFGAKVDSPTATKLPVLLGVALLKDRNGVIDMDLPISGSLDDPQFSLGGIILRVIGNLFIKAVTSPFALIGSLFGGGGEELSFVDFPPGRATITADALKKLGTVAKALNERPALHMDLVGRVDPDSDKDGLRQASLERKVKAQKMKTLLKSDAAVSLDEIKLEPAEYEKYLTEAYKEEKFPKPRNLVGLAKSLPAPEMEQLMLTNVQITDDDLRELANRRAQAVKDWLAKTGNVPVDRIFLVNSKLSAEGIKDKGKANRVDLVLK
ncbi:MAG: ATPase involved in pili bisis, partial [Betaproteobacteria bacterium]|nr:ATPase involved in pili bisis [Betaproteobacteria bacterium]